MFNKQKGYFKKKLKGIQSMIWDLEFKRFKTLYVREQIRQEYDQCRSRMEILLTNIKMGEEPGGLKEKDPGEFARLDDDKVRLEKDIERKLAQMKSLDIEVQGSKATAELPEGHQGINETITALHELIQVTKDYLKQL